MPQARHALLSEGAGSSDASLASYCQRLLDK